MLWRDINFCFLSIAPLSKRIDLVVKSKFSLLEVTQNKWVFHLKGWQYSLLWNSGKNHQSGTKIRLCGCVREFFSTLRGILSGTTLYQLSTLESTLKAPTGDILRLNTLRVTEPSILTPQRYSKHPHFLSGSPIPQWLLFGEPKSFLKEVIAWSNYHLTHKVIDLPLHSEAVLLVNYL